MSAVQEKKKRVNFTVEDQLLKRFDKRRGDVPRSVFLRRLMLQELENQQ